ncbi:MAG: TRAP transporter small permease subunit [Alphaproteobacteria bacterium]|nr:TRAP transporter small permease subunit [Alphaproteobacteria bacterium]
MQSFCRFADRLSTAVGVLAAWLIVPLVLALCWEVFARYVLNAPTIWAFEIGYLLTGSSWLLGMAYALSRDAHIRVDVMTTRMSDRAKALVDVAIYAVIVLPFVTWLVFGLQGRVAQAIRSGERSGQSAWNPPLWPFRTIMLVAFALLTIQILAQLLRGVRVLAGGKRS